MQTRPPRDLLFAEKKKTLSLVFHSPKLKLLFQRLRQIFARWALWACNTRADEYAHAHRKTFPNYKIKNATMVLFIFRRKLCGRLEQKFPRTLCKSLALMAWVSKMFPAKLNISRRDFYFFFFIHSVFEKSKKNCHHFIRTANPPRRGECEWHSKYTFPVYISHAQNKFQK